MSEWEGIEIELNEPKRKDSRFMRFYRQDEVQIIIDIVRILMLIVACLILYVLLMNIKEVQILGTDPCKLCENKTERVCISNFDIQQAPKKEYPTINISELFKDETTSNSS